MNTDTNNNAARAANDLDLASYATAFKLKARAVSDYQLILVDDRATEGDIAAYKANMEIATAHATARWNRIAATI